MIIPDINLLLYTYDTDSPFHEKAAAWWQHCMSGTEPVGLPPVVLFGFVRVSTSKAAFAKPLTVAEAARHVSSWIAQPVTQVLQTGASHITPVLTLLEGLGTGGNLVTDAQIAALAIDHHAVVHTSDTDFARFPGVRWFNPITATGSRFLRKGGGRHV